MAKSTADTDQETSIGIDVNAILTTGILQIGNAVLSTDYTNINIDVHLKKTSI